jgi:SAM-dependent methyltransferase
MESSPVMAPLDKDMAEKLSRPAFGAVLLLAAVFSMAGAALMERFGLASRDVRPLAFVGALVCFKLGLFFFWPAIRRQGTQASTILREAFEGPPPSPPAAPAPTPATAPARQQRDLVLWAERDPRVDVALFAANVPTFVVNAEQRFLDWNPAFHLVFGQCPGVRRGASVTEWFAALDNFKRVGKRQQQLYGEAILPLADRERVAFTSPRFGRMVFTKIMCPIVDRDTGRIVGWTVILNINSVGKRRDFLETLQQRVARETRRVRHAAGYDGVFDGHAGFQALVAAHVAPVTDLCDLHARGLRGRVLDLGAGTGAASLALLRAGHRVTAVDRGVHLLRRLRDKTTDFAARLRIVKRSLDALPDLPEARFDAAVMLLQAHRVHDLATLLGQVHASLRPGGVLTISGLVAGQSLERFYQDVHRHLEAAGRFEALKHQFAQVLEHEREIEAEAPASMRTRGELRLALEAAGFQVEDGPVAEAFAGSVALMIARK